MIKQEEVFKIGKLTKTHGLQGEISFHFDNDVFDRVECPYLILNIDGIYVPFFVQEYRFKATETALITFQDVDSQEKAYKLQGLSVYFPREYAQELDNDDEFEQSWNYFIGFAAIDKDTGKLGTIVSVDTQTINTLFLIEADDGEEYIVPAVEEFILEIDNDKKEIHFALPEGLLEK